ncbi:MFS transporter [Paenibacillus puerhi]|uniref:MFS transporter n=1 Tax=Paenibacillus puerhi TaxID=2692622 RepID=UPI0013585B10|nr:MFS transporter [Paenibacillus puerhi]
MSKKFLVFLVSTAAFFGPFTQTIYTPLLPEIAEQFHASQNAVNLTVSIYPIFFAFMQLIYGPLIDKYGRRRILLIGFMFYLFATVGAALSYTVPILIIFRALQAIGVAVGSVAAITIIGDLFEGKMRGRSMGIYQMLVALGPGLGPIFGGFIGQYYGINGLFWFLLGISLALWIVLFFSLPETRTVQGGSDRFRFRQLSAVLTHRIGLGIVVLGSVQYSVFYSLLVLLPNILDDLYALTPSQTGLMFLPISICIVIGSLIGGRIQEHYETKKLLVVLSSFNMASVFLFAIAASVSLPILTVSISVFGIFLGVSLPLQTTLLANVMPLYRATSTGVYNFFRYVWMTIGPVVGTTFYWMGYELEFYAYGIIFACALLFIYRQFFSHTTNIKSSTALD